MACDIGHRLKSDRFDGIVQCLIVEQFDIDMSFTGVRNSIDQTLAMFGVA